MIEIIINSQLQHFQASLSTYYYFKSLYEDIFGENVSIEDMNEEQIEAIFEYYLNVSYSSGEIAPPVVGSVPISSKEQLDSIRYKLDGIYHLTADIDLGGEEWIPIGDKTKFFGGTLDGQGYKITNGKITGNYQYSGLFGYISNATIKNLRVGITIDYIGSSSTITYAGGICGYVKTKSYISNCYNMENISVSSKSSNVYTGGICGYSNNARNIIAKCYNEGEITATATSSARSTYAGGICGYSRGNIGNCYNVGKIFANSVSHSYAGGICGENNRTVMNCYNIGNLAAAASSTSLSSSIVGGICEKNPSSSSSVKRSYWNSDSKQILTRGEGTVETKVGLGTNILRKQKIFIKGRLSSLI